MLKDKLIELRQMMEEYKTVRVFNVKAGGSFLKIKTSDYELNNGNIITREQLIKNNAVVMLPIVGDNILLIIQPAPLTRSGVSLQLPAGYIDNKELAIDAAKRELIEETGYSSEDVMSLGFHYQDQGCSASLVESFIMYDAIKTHEQHLDFDESAKTFLCSYKEAMELVNMGMINDANSVITLYKAKEMLIKSKTKRL